MPIIPYNPPPGLPPLQDNNLTPVAQTGRYASPTPISSSTPPRVADITTLKELFKAIGFIIRPEGFDSNDYQAGVSGFRVSSPLIEAENLLSRGTMRGSTFAYDMISAIGGQLMIANAGALSEDMTALDSSKLTIRSDTTFAVNDMLVMRNVASSSVQEEWLRVTDVSGAPEYVVTRDLAGIYSANSNPEWKAGTPVVKQGSSDGASTYSGGWLKLLGEGTNSPYYAVFVRTGVAYNAYSEVARFGNLNGFLDYVSNLYGIAIGDSSAYLKYDPTNGMRISGNINTIKGYTANESITAGDRVSIISSSAEKSVRHNLANPGANSDFSSGTNIFNVTTAKVADDKFVVMYRDASKWYGIVGSVDKETLAITYGSAVQVGGTVSSVDCNVCYVSDDKVAFLYVDSSSDLQVVIGSVSGTTLTINTPATVFTDAAVLTRSAYMDLINTDKLAIMYTTDGGNLVVLGASISGTTITVDTANKVTTAGFATDARKNAACKAATDKFFVALRDSSGNGSGKAYSFSGTVPTAGATNDFDSGTGIDYLSCARLADNSILIVWTDTSGTPSSSSVVASIATVTTSYGSVVNFGDNVPTATTYGSHHSVIALSSTRAIVMRMKVGDSAAYWNEIDLSSGSICIQNDNSINSNGQKCAAALLTSSRNRFVLVNVESNSNGRSQVFSEYDNTNKFKLLGIATNTVSAGGTVNVQSTGLVTGLSGLTAGETYYHDFRSNTLTTTNTGVQIGVAISTTTLELRIEKVPYAKCVNTTRNENASTGYQKIYHNLGRVPSRMFFDAGNINNAGAGIQRKNSRGVATSTSVSDQVYSEEYDSTGLSTSTKSGGSSFVIHTGDSNAVVVAVDQFSVTLNFSTHSAAAMDSSGLQFFAEIS